MAWQRASIAGYPATPNQPALLRVQAPKPALARRWLRVAGNAAVAVLAAVIIAGVIASFAPRFLGYSTAIVRGGSMGESLPVGSLAVLEEVDPQAVEVGDVILFFPPEHAPGAPPVLHRVVSVRAEGGQTFFMTKGDANETPDPWEIGLDGQGARLAYHVPVMGYLLDFAHSPLGWATLVVAPSAYLCFAMLRRLWAARSPPR